MSPETSAILVSSQSSCSKSDMYINEARDAVLSAKKGVAYATRHSVHRRSDNPTRDRRYEATRKEIKKRKLRGNRRQMFKRYQAEIGNLPIELVEYSESSSGDDVCTDLNKSVAADGIAYTNKVDFATMLSLVANDDCFNPGEKGRR